MFRYTSESELWYEMPRCHPYAQTDHTLLLIYRIVKLVPNIYYGLFWILNLKKKLCVVYAMKILIKLTYILLSRKPISY